MKLQKEMMEQCRLLVYCPVVGYTNLRTNWPHLKSRLMRPEKRTRATHLLAHNDHLQTHDRTVGGGGAGGGAGGGVGEEWRLGETGAS